MLWTRFWNQKFYLQDQETYILPLYLTSHCGYSSVISLSSDRGENSIMVRNGQSGFDAECPNKEDVCCEKPLETNPDVTENCADDPDYHCVGIQVGKIFCLVYDF